MAKRITRESERHLEGFRIFAGLGPGRRLSDVARKLGVSETSVQLWARSFDWEGRAAAHDAGVGKRTREIADRDGVEHGAQARAQNLALVRLLKMKIAKAASEGEVNLRVSDLVALLRAEQALTDSEPHAAGRDGDDSALDGLPVEELWGLARTEVDALNHLAAHCREVRRLEAEGRIMPLPRLLDIRGTPSGDGTGEAPGGS